MYVIGEFDKYSFNNNHVIDIFRSNQERNFPYFDSEMTQFNLYDKNEEIFTMKSDKELNEEVSLFY
jgi:hypothetical protein